MTQPSPHQEEGDSSPETSEHDGVELVTEWNWPFIGGAAAIILVLALVVGYMSLRGDDPAPTTTTTTTPPATTQLSERSTIADLLPLDTQFITLVELARSSGVLDDLDDAGPYTLLAPEEAAWDEVQVPDPDADPEGAAALLRRHLVDGALSTADLRALDGKSVTTLSGEELQVEVTEDGTVTVGGAAVIKPQIVASNGVILVLDQPVAPQT